MEREGREVGGGTEVDVEGLAEMRTRSVTASCHSFEGLLDQENNLSVPC